MIRYFVSYSHSRGFGNCQVSLKRPIRSHEDIAAVADLIRRNNGLDGVVVISFQRFDQD